MFPIIHWDLILLEVLITTTLVGLVLVDMFLAKDVRRDWVGILSFVALFGLIIFWFSQRNLTGATFGGMFIVDSLAWFFKGFFLIAMVFVFAMTQQFFDGLERTSPPIIPSKARDLLKDPSALQPQDDSSATSNISVKNQFYLLLWLALLGMCLVASSADFLLMFISIEILTISLYVMTAYLKTDKLSIEAGMKYLILGALSSGFLLYGISLMYGVTHSTRFEAIQSFVGVHPMSPMSLLALILIFAGVGFKIAAVPFHMWVPDVYQGAPTPVTALLSVGSKAAGFVFLMRLFFGVFTPWHLEWNLLLAILSAATMCYGNLVAMFQTNIKRLLGYSSIGHAGYLLMGAVAGSVLGASAINFYLVGYLFTNLAAFLVIVLFFIATKSDSLDDYNGLSKRSGILAAALLLALVSLAGIPPMVGFFGKFTLLMATVKSGFVWLALIAVVNIVISTYYYLMVVKRLYVDSPRNPSLIAVSLPMRFLLGVAMLGIVGIGLIQGPFLDAAMTAVKGMFFASTLP